MLKQWAIVIGLSAGIAVGTSAIAGGDECASKQTRADTTVSAEKSAAQSQSTTTEKTKQDVAAN
jgi:hypothetical protein